MKIHLLRFSILSLLLLIVLGVPAVAQADSAKPTLWIIGDSTVKNGANGGVGWGEVIHEAFDMDRISVVNRAVGGRSSRTYRTEGKWSAVLDLAKPGDFVMMQFGHNDGIAPDDPKRPRGSLHGVGDETRTIVHPHTEQEEVVHTYGWYMRQYVIEAQAKGVTPIVCSYVPRAPRPGQTISPSLESYGEWAQQVAQQEDAAFLNLFSMIASEYAQLEERQPHVVKETFFVGGDRDYTHTNRDGAVFNAGVVEVGIRQLDGDAGLLASYLKKS